MFVCQTAVKAGDSVSPWSRGKLFAVMYNIDHVSFRGKGQADLLPIIKDLGSLSLGFLSWNTTHYVCRFHLAFTALPLGNWSLGNRANDDTLDTASTVSNKLCFVPDPLSSAASMKLWQPSFLACKKGKTSDPS